LSKVNPRFRTELVVVRELGVAYFRKLSFVLSPIRRNPVLEELRVKRLADRQTYIDSYNEILI